MDCGWTPAGAVMESCGSSSTSMSSRSANRLPGGRLDFVKHTLVTLEVEEIEALELAGFGPQNVLDELVLEEVTLATGRQIQVTLPRTTDSTRASAAAGNPGVRSRTVAAASASVAGATSLKKAPNSRLAVPSPTHRGQNWAFCGTRAP